jgi:hypothetical protein
MSYVKLEDAIRKSEGNNNVYQVQYVEKNKAIIRKVGSGDEKSLKILESEHNNYKYIIMSHIITDLTNLDMLSLIIMGGKRRNFYLTISLEFESESRDINKIIEGIYKFYLNKNGERHLLDKYDSFKNNEEIINTIFNYIVDKRIVDILVEKN